MPPLSLGAMRSNRLPRAIEAESPKFRTLSIAATYLSASASLCSERSRSRSNSTPLVPLVATGNAPRTVLQFERQRVPADAAHPWGPHGCSGSLQEGYTTRPLRLCLHEHTAHLIVALANKLARIAWALLARDRQYLSVQTATG